MAEINYCAYAERLEQLRRHPSAFIEEVCGIKLNHFQKIMVDQINKIKPTPRNPMKKWETYINLLFAYSKMKDDDHIIIASPKEWKKLNKVEFAEYIEHYWEDNFND